jgi:hypothetical protein
LPELAGAPPVGAPPTPIDVAAAAANAAASSSEGEALPTVTVSPASNAASALGTLSAPAIAATSSSERLVSAPRRVSLAGLAAWSKPGLCSTAEDAEATREKLTASFRGFDGGLQGRIYLDPRLPEGAEVAVLALLSQAQVEVERGLALRPSPPATFVYFDQQLMKAAACINEDVVAFYDGSLHLVMLRSDLQQSVTHEYAHHALFGSGLQGPAWAQEGIAMLVAAETWWQAPARLQAIAEVPFAQEQMESLIPYKLPADQAVAFYVQSALTVQCLLRLRGWSLQELTAALRGGSGPDSISYDLPELQPASFVSNCLAAGAARR